MKKPGDIDQESWDKALEVFTQFTEIKPNAWRKALVSNRVHVAKAIINAKAEQRAADEKIVTIHNTTYPKTYVKPSDPRARERIHEVSNVCQSIIRSIRKGI